MTEPRIIRPEHKLGKILGEQGGGIRKLLSPSLLESVRKLMDSKEGNFAAQLRENVRRLEESYLALRKAHNPGERASALRGVSEEAYLIRTRGTLAGYPLASEIGRLLCNYLQSDSPDSPAEAVVVQHHLQALQIGLDSKPERRETLTQAETNLSSHLQALIEKFQQPMVYTALPETEAQ